VRAFSVHPAGVLTEPPDTVQGSGVKAWATDPQRAARLWLLSGELTEIDAFGSGHRHR